MWEELKRIVGEALHPKRTLAHYCCIVGVWVLLFLPFATFNLINTVVPNNPLAQFSVFAVAPILGGLALAAAAGFREAGRTRPGSSGAKYMVVTALFIVFFPHILIVGSAPPIDIYSLELSRVGLVSGFFFWLAISSFLLGLSLFLVALVDLIFAGNNLIRELVHPKEEFPFGLG